MSEPVRSTYGVRALLREHDEHISRARYAEALCELLVDEPEASLRDELRRLASSENARAKDCWSRAIEAARRAGLDFPMLAASRV